MGFLIVILNLQFLKPESVGQVVFNIIGLYDETSTGNVSTGMNRLTVMSQYEHWAI